MRATSISNISALLAVSLGATACVVYTNQPPQQQAQPSAPPPAQAPTAAPTPQPKPAQAATAKPASPKLSAKPSLRIPVGALPAPSGKVIEVDGKPVPVVSKAGPFGHGNEKPGSMRGLVFFLPEPADKLPDFSSLAPTAALFTDKLDVAPQDFTQGFPDVDARNEWFAIRYDGQFSTKLAGDYEFRLVSDDGATLKVANVLLIDNDGRHGPTEKRAKIRLLPGSHPIEVKYFQAERPKVALQLFVTPPNGKEKLWSNEL